MQHLISRIDLGRVESSLLLRRDEITKATSMMFNIVILLVVVGGFIYFLYVQYNTDHTEFEEKRIPFEPTTWYSATRNVRSEEYGHQLQPFEIETGYGVS